jgi:hypothetical protein
MFILQKDNRKLKYFPNSRVSHITKYKNPLPKRKGEFGGAKRDRTADLLLARQALSQLSYSPICV